VLHVDALIFDLDGTLWDTNAICAEAWNRVLQRMGIERPAVTEADIAGICGRPHREAVGAVLSELDEAKLDAISVATEREDNLLIAERGGRLYPGVRELIPELAERFPLMIVSNCQDGYIEVFLEQSGLDASFRDHECWGRTGNTKSENLRSVIARNGVRAPLFVGDTEGDARAARDNAVPFVFASYGFGEVEVFDLQLHRFEQLAGRVAPLG